MKNSVRAAVLLFVGFGLCAISASIAAAQSVVRVVKTSSGFQLQRDGIPYFVKGAGGDADKARLHALGANSWRTWGADNLDSQLSTAQSLGMTVTAGIWLGHKDQGFHYHDPAAVQAQLDSVKRTVLRYRNAPALLIWALGNESETGQEDDPAYWSALETMAAAVKKLDPNHPILTVVAEIGGDKVAQFQAHCPDFDILGINSYGGAASLAGRYAAAGGKKPYLVTEFGTRGWWETEKNTWGAAIEPTSTAKAQQYREAYQKSIASQPLSLGSYAFTWGNKVEGTPTWFGMLLEDGSRLGADDILSDLWSGRAPQDRCPAIESLTLESPDTADPGATVKVSLKASDPIGLPTRVQYELRYDPLAAHIAGGGEAAPVSFPEAVTQSSGAGATVILPRYGGAYRLYATVRDGHGGAAVANVPLFVRGNVPLSALPTPRGKLPVVLYSSAGGNGDSGYAPSGYEGNYGAIHLNPDCTVQPHNGKTCLEAQYTAGDAWGGVIWQSPASDWGDKPGGLNLTGARRLTFWARGDRGGEVVTFLFGVLKGKAFSDSASGSLERVTLSRFWHRYTIDLDGKDLSRIKTGFGWVVAAPGSGVTFYLDDIRYE